MDEAEGGVGSLSVGTSCESGRIVDKRVGECFLLGDEGRRLFCVAVGTELDDSRERPESVDETFSIGGVLKR